jgi:hypothetical protein
MNPVMEESVVRPNEARPAWSVRLALAAKAWCTVRLGKGEG